MKKDAGPEMPKDRTGGPAFPELAYGNDGVPVQIQTGMSLRAYFAAKAMQGLCANTLMADALAEREIADRYILTAKTACMHADALIAELERE